MKQTQNYQLNQWEMTDLIKMEDFNGDNSKVDAALKTLAGQVASKASSSTVSSLSTKVNTKAAQSDLTAAVNRVTALESGKAEKTALAAEQTARENADSTEKAAREAADTALENTLRGENCWIKLGEVTLTQDQAQMNFDLSGLDMTKYRTLELHGELSFQESSTPGLRFNGTTHDFSNPNNTGNGTDYAAFYSNYSHFSGFVKVQSSMFKSGLIVYSMGATYGANNTPTGCTTYSDKLQFTSIRSIQLLCFSYTGAQGTLKSGSSMTLYGLKK